MINKSLITLGFVGFLAISIGIVKPLESTKVFAEGQLNINNEVEFRHVSMEEQVIKERNFVGGKAITTVITVDEQNQVENSSDFLGFVPQKKGTGFFFLKEK